MPHKIRVEAKEVSLAIEKGLKELGLRRDQVEVKVLENPRKGFLGIGSRPAVVELQKKRWNSNNLDAQIYMDVPKKRRAPGKKSNNRRGRKDDKNGVREIKHGGRRSYNSRRRSEQTPRENEPQLLPSQEIQQAVIPDFLKAPMQQAQEYITNILTHMEVKTENMHTWWDEKQNRILLTFDCDHPAIVIGKEGKTLESLQYLTTLSISRHFDKPISVVIDTQNYWRKMEDKINSDLEHGIMQIKNGYSVYRFRPMSAQLRRYIHRAAEDNEFVITVSEGEGQWRKVTLRPRPADQPIAKQEPAPTVVETTEIVTEVAVVKEPDTITPAATQEMPVEPAPAQTTAQTDTDTVAVSQTVAEQPAPSATAEQPVAPATTVEENK